MNFFIFGAIINGVKFLILVSIFLLLAYENIVYSCMLILSPETLLILLICSRVGFFFTISWDFLGRQPCYFYVGIVVFLLF